MNGSEDEREKAFLLFDEQGRYVTHYGPGDGVTSASEALEQFIGEFDQPSVADWTVKAVHADDLDTALGGLTAQPSPYRLHATAPAGGH